MADIPILLLAAGGSTRMGEPKQLLPWGNVTLIEHQIQTLIKTNKPIFVVLGSKAKSIMPIVNKFEINTVINYQWETGMGSSVSIGVERIIKVIPNAEGVLISLLDQPLITHEHLDNILKAFQPGMKQIIVSQSEKGWQGVPVLFDKTYFIDLKKLNGQEGAKKIIHKHSSSVINIECKNILEDMDTPESYHRLRSNLSTR